MASKCISHQRMTLLLLLEEMYSKSSKPAPIQMNESAMLKIGNVPTAIKSSTQPSIILLMRLAAAPPTIKPKPTSSIFVFFSCIDTRSTAAKALEIKISFSGEGMRMLKAIFVLYEVWIRKKFPIIEIFSGNIFTIIIAPSEILSARRREIHIRIGC